MYSNREDSCKNLRAKQRCGRWEVFKSPCSTVSCFLLHLQQQEAAPPELEPETQMLSKPAKKVRARKSKG